ncbi:MAG: hypothetical protein L6V93_15025 [Clostridiales bacterium]|nr:MAG: hypothetical protein L6V93_15025 [Clostridiales bacterium]
MLLKGYSNTLFVLIFGVAVNIVMTICGAYFFIAQKREISKNHFHIHNNHNVFKRRYDTVFTSL